MTITGTSFTGATAVDFGTTPATNFTVVNDTTITADSPAGTGTVDVTVTTPVGTSATSPADQFTYTAVAAPTVTGLSPTTGPATGGTLVTITGRVHRRHRSRLRRRRRRRTVTVVNDTTITADSPAGTGTVDVTVTTPAGTSPRRPPISSPTPPRLRQRSCPWVRDGFHMQPTTLVLTFSSALINATSAQNINNYQIMSSSGIDIPISSAVYDAATFTVTLSPSQLLSLHTFYQLTVIGTPPTGLTSATGVPIDGADNGTSGTNFVMTFSGEILAGPAPTLLRTDPKRFAAEQRKLARSTRRRQPTRTSRPRDVRVWRPQRKGWLPSPQSWPPTPRGSSAASAVDVVLRSGTVSVKRIVAKRRSAQLANERRVAPRVVSEGNLD